MCLVIMVKTEEEDTVYDGGIRTAFAWARLRDSHPLYHLSPPPLPLRPAEKRRHNQSRLVSMKDTCTSRAPRDSAVRDCERRPCLRPEMGGSLARMGTKLWASEPHWAEMRGHATNPRGPRVPSETCTASLPVRPAGSESESRSISDNTLFAISNTVLRCLSATCYGGTEHQGN